MRARIRDRPIAMVDAAGDARISDRPSEMGDAWDARIRDRPIEMVDAGGARIRARWAGDAGDARIRARWGTQGMLGFGLANG